MINKEHFENLSDSEKLDKLLEFQNKINFYENILDSLPIGVFLKDTYSRYKYVNRYLIEQNNNRLTDNFIGKTDAELFNSSDLSKEYVKTDNIVLMKKELLRQKVPFIDSDGMRYFEMLKKPFFTNEKISGFLGCIIPPDENLSTEFFQNPHFSTSLIFNYMVTAKNFVILRGLENFSYFNQGNMTLINLLDSGIIYESDLPKIRRAFYMITTKHEKTVRCTARFYDDTENLKMCGIQLNPIYNNKKQAIQILGMLYPLSDIEIQNEILNEEVELAKNHYLDFLHDSFDVCLYVNPDLNYYKILHSNAWFQDIAQTGEWNSFIDLMYDRLYPKDYGVIKNIFKVLNQIENNSESHQKDFTNNEFRLADNFGNFNWKSFKVHKIDGINTGGFLIMFFDINDAVVKRNERQLKNFNANLIDVLSSIVEFRDMESGEHISRIKMYTRLLLRQAVRLFPEHQYSPEEIETISIASAMHDIGKIAIPDNILLKPGKLSSEEFEIMKTHTIRGCEIIMTMPKIQSESYFKYCYEICRHHHERYDGKGYPDGLKGEEIPFVAQIVSIADVFDALTSDRCYKEAFSFEKASEMIINGECGIFSPKLLDCFTQARPSMESYASSNTVGK